jgi:superfamily I DNA/RNA helicase
VKEYRLHGPPGTGKTRSLADVWVPRAAAKFGPGNVVICSLTKTAAAEIASRDLPIPRENVGTLHALAYRALGRPTIAEGEIKAWNEAEPLYRLSGGGPSMDHPEVGRGERGTKGDELMALAQVYRHRRLPAAAWREDVANFQRKWASWMAQEGLVDFTGLIEDALEAVPVAPGDPSVFVVDEAQDCSVLELDLVRKWAAHAEDGVVLAGDGDQAIYGWRGASARAFLDPGIPPENNYHLTQSYRVPVAVHALASKWIAQASYRYAVEYLPRDHPGEVSDIDGNAKDAMPIVDAAVKAADQGKSVMILASCGYMLRNTITLLRREGVPFHNPYRPTHGGWNPLRGGSGRLLAYLRPDPETYPQDYRIWTWAEAAAWVEVVKAKESFAAGGKTMIRQQAKEDEKEQRSSTIEPGDGKACFGPAWQELQDAFAGRAPLEWIESRILPSKTKLMEYPLAVAKIRGTQTLREKPRICVGTQHSTKGGQADVVILIPDLSPSGMREWTRPGDGRDGIIRTFYVGMTRAREKLLMAGRWSAASIDWRRLN